MAKRGETRPWRMTYRWPQAQRGVETFMTAEHAQDAARRQVEVVGGVSRKRDCTAIVRHRDRPEADFYRACPQCGKATRWDTVYEPSAWRHTESESRWCTPGDDERDVPPMPWGTSHRPEYPAVTR